MSMSVQAVEALVREPGFTRALEADAEIPAELYDEGARAGMFALGVPRRHGGLEVPLRERLELHALIAGGSAGLHSVLCAHEMAVNAIARFAPEAVGGRWLGGMAAGRCRGAFALTEPAGGSSFQQIATAMTGSREDCRVDGTKAWISSALDAGVIVTFGKSGGALSAALVAGDAPGLTVAPSAPLIAFGAASMGDIRFVRCPAIRLGAPGLAAVRIATACLSIGRVLVAVGALAVADAALEALVAHARARTVGEMRLAAHDLVKQAVAEVYVARLAGQALVREAATAVDGRDVRAPRLAIVAKLAAAEAARIATNHAETFCGAGGLTAGAPVQRLVAQAAIYRAIEGSAQALSVALGADVLAGQPARGAAKLGRP